MNDQLNQLVESLDGYTLDRKIVGSSTLWEVYFPTFSLDLTHSEKGWKFKFENLDEALKFDCETIWYHDFDDLKKKLESTIVRSKTIQPDYSCYFDDLEDDLESESENAYWAARQKVADENWKAESDKRWNEYCNMQWKQYYDEYCRLHRTDILR
jgi:hypothetical protein